MNAPLNPTPRPDQLLIDKAARLVPSLRERGQRISETRCMPEDVLQDLRDAGLMEVLRPTRFGGRGMRLDTMVRVTQELARGDGSTAWVYVVLNLHDPFVGMYSLAVQEEYWNSARPLCGSSFSPTGKVTPVSGGFKASGKWSFSSGIDYCGWIIVGGIAGMPEGTEKPDLRFFLIPDSDYRIEDDWFSSGMTGTGSKSVIMDDVFVPAERIISVDDITACRFPDPGTREDPAYTQPMWTSSNFGMTSPATGIARAAYEQFLEESRAKVGKDRFFDLKKPAVQMHLAEAAAMIDCAELLYMQSLNEHFTNLELGIVETERHRAKYRRNQAYSALTARKATEILLGMVGSKSVHTHHPVARAVRDLYAVTAHVRGNWDGAALNFGSIELGGDPVEFML